MAAEQQRLLGRRTAGLDPDFVPDLECPDALRRGVELTGENAVRLLASCPLLSRLEELDASDNLIRAAGVGPLAHTPYLGNLRRLDLSANDFAPAGTRWAACLATAGLARARLPALRTLRLNGNGLSAESVGVLAAAAWLPELEAIELAGNRIESAGPLLRLARGGPCLRSIALDGNPLGGRAAGEVARALAAGPAAGATR
jgi:Ran GTPase-activating protein (RanGAP) involved in mRNA processing and transport